VGDDLLVGTGSGSDSVDVGFSDQFSDRIFGAMTVRDDTWIELGSEDDVLEILDSVFDSRFFADGGLGTDTLIESGNTYSSRPVFVRFERREAATLLA
jgi:hypothetical protein